MIPDFSKMMGMMGGGKGKSFEESDFEWSEDAKKRVERVPAGFMRNMTMKRIEDYAQNKGVNTITLEIAEEGLAESSSMMSSMMGGGKKKDDTKKNDLPQTEKNVSEPQAGESSVRYYFCEMCGYTIKGFPPAECPICLSAKEKFILITDENRKQRLTETSGRVMRWENDAHERLEKIPPGFMRDMTKWRIEMLARSEGNLNITNKIVDGKYEHWKEGTKGVELKMSWDSEAEERINRIPDFVRGMVQKEIERQAKNKGLDRVTSEFLTSIREKWNSGEEFHHE